MFMIVDKTVNEIFFLLFDQFDSAIALFSFFLLSLVKREGKGATNVYIC